MIGTTSKQPHFFKSAATHLTTQCSCLVQGGQPEVIVGTTSKQPVIDVSPEVFALRKLLPQTADYDFNIHIMDFKPGEYLYVKVRSPLG